MGSRGHGLPIPMEVAKHLSPEAQHQAFRGLLLRFMCQAQQRELSWEEKDTLHRMEGSLQNGGCVWEEVSTFVVELFGDKVTVNVIMGVTTLEELPVTSFAGEEEDRMQLWRCLMCAVLCMSARKQLQ